jgi:cell wall assembly regulator SMI1
MELHGRELKVDMPPGATFELIERADHDAELRLPAELRYFLEHADGLDARRNLQFRRPT